MKNEQMKNEEKETALMVTGYNIEKNMRNAKIALAFFVAGLIGTIAGIIFRNVDIGHNFFVGFLHGAFDAIAPGAMIVGLCYVIANIRSLKEEKERILNKQ